MSARGGSRTEAHKKAFTAGGIRAQHKKRKRIAQLSAGTGEEGSGHDFRREAMAVTTSPAVWLRATEHIGDCQYVDDGLDPIMLRALSSRVLYAGSCYCHYESPLQEVTIEIIAAATREAMKPAGRGQPPKAKGLLRSYRTKTTVTTPKVKKLPAKKLSTPYREGKSLAEVVAEMFPE